MRGTKDCIMLFKDIDPDMTPYGWAEPDEYNDYWERMENIDPTDMNFDPEDFYGDNLTRNDYYYDCECYDDTLGTNLDGKERCNSLYARR